MWIKAPNIKCVHGFSTRHGGYSQAPFDSLNLGGTEDQEQIILRNREVALSVLQFKMDQLCNLKQVHGTSVCEAKPGKQEGDALVSNQKNKILAISIADCYPILFYDEVNAVIGAAHAGWRGTVNKIAGNTVDAMLELGAKVEHIQVAIGQGISQKHFEVGSEVIEQFNNAGFSSACWQHHNIDLIQCNVQVLLEKNIPNKNIWSMNRCTFEKDFFSYRQDKGITGRMWGVIALQ